MHYRPLLRIIRAATKVCSGFFFFFAFLILNIFGH